METHETSTTEGPNLHLCPSLPKRRDVSLVSRTGRKLGQYY